MLTTKDIPVKFCCFSIPSLNQHVWVKEMLHGSVCTCDGSSVPHFLIVSGWGIDLPIRGPSPDPLLYRPCRELYLSGLPNQLGVGREN